MNRQLNRTLHQLMRGKNPLSILVLAGLLAFAYWLEPPTPRRGQDEHAAARGRYEGRCIRVLDGDTIDVRADSGEEFRLRLLGVDCMETHNEEKLAEQARRLGRTTEQVRRLGERGRDRTRALLLRQAIAWEVPEGTPLFDPYDRMLAYVERDGEDVGELLLREGLAELRRDPHPRSVRYRGSAAPLAW
ncbi:MAG TPA: thermonuclease family protein [Kiritimatiellia bacterium]|nr:thermonuclease family protein [Kiritimatiellia bacterium]HMP33529.1 thermonuclease family protein [Kiritimatiellia bacterium]